jgi:hypothetical protein
MPAIRKMREKLFDVSSLNRRERCLSFDWLLVVAAVAAAGGKERGIFD